MESLRKIKTDTEYLIDQKRKERKFYKTLVKV